MKKIKIAKIEVGNKYQQLTVLVAAPKTDPHKRWRCLCDCGTEKVIRDSDLRAGQQSCGHRRVEAMGATGKLSRTHGMSRNGTPEYSTWASMCSRTQPDSSYDLYRGMEVEQAWRDSFEEFYKDMGPKPTRKHTIDRIDGTRGYVRGNVRWATQKEQIDNRAVTYMVTMQGRTMCVRDWCRELGLKEATVYGRMNLKGQSPEEALASSPRRPRSHRAG